MNDQNQNPIPNPSPAPEYSDPREQRRAERHARNEARWQRHTGRHYGWMGGVILILLGFVFLLQNMGINYLTNWWALFILIPAFWAYVGAWDVYQDNGQLTRGAASSLILGLMLTLLSFVFLLNLAVNMFWPLLLIAGGLALVLTSLLPK